MPVIDHTSPEAQAFIACVKQLMLENPISPTDAGQHVRHATRGGLLRILKSGKWVGYDRKVGLAAGYIKSIEQYITVPPGSMAAAYALMFTGGKDGEDSHRRDRR